MEFPPKICPCCEKNEIQNWESACWWCWQYIEWHDREHETNWCRSMRVFNHMREFLRSCGIDPVVAVNP